MVTAETMIDEATGDVVTEPKQDKRTRETAPVTQQLFDFLAGFVPDVTVKGNSIKFPFNEFGVITISPKLPAVAGGGAGRSITVEYEVAAEAILQFVALTGDMSASGYEKYRKAEANQAITSEWASAHTIKNSFDGKWIANEVLKDYLTKLKG